MKTTPSHSLTKNNPHMNYHLLALPLIAFGIFSVSSCLPLAVGAAAGYVAHDEGYRVQAPLKKTGD